MGELYTYRNSSPYRNLIDANKARLWSKNVLTLLATQRNHIAGYLGHSQCVVDQSVFFNDQ